MKTMKISSSDKFEICYADPPWRYDFSETESRKIENHYPTATVEEIISHKPNMADDSLLLMWATAPKLLEGLEVMKGWEFTYRTNAVWNKMKIGMGYWFRGQHEILLVGTKGNPDVPDEKNRIPSVFPERRGRHSKKPDCVYRWIESAFPDKKKLEMYARNTRPGWTSFGNELGGYVHTPEEKNIFFN
jgi:N6-adenosine-specific RNA methylase IME4